MGPNQKGAIAEAEIAAAAVQLGIPVLKPVAEHCRYDLALEIGGRIFRVQCKWGSFDPRAGVINVNLESSWCGPHGYIRTSYQEHEIDLLAVYCDELDRSFLLPGALVTERRAISLRISPCRNAQRACINLASTYEFAGAVAQLGERLRGTQEATGSSPVSSTPRLLAWADVSLRWMGDGVGRHCCFRAGASARR